MAFIGNQPTAVPLTSSQLTDGLITTDKLAASAVTSAKILDSTIVNADIASTTINLTQKVTGTLPFANGGTGLSTLGTAGQALIVNSSATALSYATVGGKVLQVISATDSTERTTTSTTFVTASNTLTVAITPSSASNKIYTVVSLSIRSLDSQDTSYTIFRDATNLGQATNGFILLKDFQYNGGSMSFLDSPSTTSALTYQVYCKTISAGTGARLNNGPATSVITCFEIAG